MELWCIATALFRGAVALTLLVTLGGCNEESAQSSQSSPAAQPPAAVGTVVVERRPVTVGLSFVGRVEAVDTVEIRARVAGFLEERASEEIGRAHVCTPVTTALIVCRS